MERHLPLPPLLRDGRQAHPGDLGQVRHLRVRTGRTHDSKGKKISTVKALILVNIFKVGIGNIQYKEDYNCAPVNIKKWSAKEAF